MDIKQKSIRAFLAADIDEQCRQQLHNVIHELSRESHGAKINWVPAENLHLTLRFLGDLPSDQIKAMLPTIAQQTKHVLPFTLQFGKLDLLPHRHPHYYAVTIILNTELAALETALNSALSKFNIEPDKRPFFPHLTLGRIKKTNKPLPGGQNINMPDMAQVNSFGLYQSTLSSSGAIYTPIQRFSLNPL